jgi:biopolymer transport protein TolR
VAATPISSRGGFRRRNKSRVKPMSEINVTPFVDVMLVLLIVFMVSAPLLTAGVPVDLPQAQAKPLTIDKPPITVTVKDGKVFLLGDEAPVPIDDLVAKLMAATKNNLDERIYVRGDRAASYGEFMKVMGKINSAGFTHVGLVALNEPDT